MENVFGNDFDQSQEEPGYQWDRIRPGRRLGGELLGASVYVLPAGEKSFPYHLHHANEELLLVLEGDVAVRTPSGETSMTTAPARFVMFSTMLEPEIAEYPDNGNIGFLAGRAPGAAGEARLERFLDGTAEREYFAQG